MVVESIIVKVKPQNDWLFKIFDNVICCSKDLFLGDKVKIFS